MQTKKKKFASSLSLFPGQKLRLQRCPRPSSWSVGLSCFFPHPQDSLSLVLWETIKKKNFSPEKRTIEFFFFFFFGGGGLFYQSIKKKSFFSLFLQQRRPTSRRRTVDLSIIFRPVCFFPSPSPPSGLT